MTSSLIIGPLQAYRCWRMEWQGKLPVLGSLYHSTVWPPANPLRATCEKRPSSLAAWIRRRFFRPLETHAAPAWKCECGIYAFAGLQEDAALELPPQFYQRGPLDRVIRVAGVVQLWGRVVQHRHGYRAEYARPLKVLAGPPPTRIRDAEDLLDAIAERYAIQLVTCVEDLARAA